MRPPFLDSAFVEYTLSTLGHLCPKTILITHFIQVVAGWDGADFYNGMLCSDQSTIKAWACPEAMGTSIERGQAEKYIMLARNLNPPTLEPTHALVNG